MKSRYRIERAIVEDGVGETDGLSAASARSRYPWDRTVAAAMA